MAWKDLEKYCIPSEKIKKDMQYIILDSGFNQNIKTAEHDFIAGSAKGVACTRVLVVPYDPDYVLQEDDIIVDSSGVDLIVAGLTGELWKNCEYKYARIISPSKIDSYFDELNWKEKSIKKEITSTSELKVGMKVRIKGDLFCGAEYNGVLVVPDMQSRKGEIVTITRIINERAFKIKEDHESWSFSFDMIDCIVDEEEKEVSKKIKVGDIQLPCMIVVDNDEDCIKIMNALDTKWAYNSSSSAYEGRRTKLFFNVDRTVERSDEEYHKEDHDYGGIVIEFKDIIFHKATSKIHWTELLPKTVITDIGNLSERRTVLVNCYNAKVSYKEALSVEEICLLYGKYMGYTCAKGWFASIEGKRIYPDYTIYSFESIDWSETKSAGNFKNAVDFKVKACINTNAPKIAGEYKLAVRKYKPSF